MTLIQLFFSFLYVGLFAIGGGYAIIPLIEQQVVKQHGWLTGVEFADILTISQLTPGPIALNCASFVGARLGGIAGSVIATFACILPACVVVAILALLYERLHNHPVWAGALTGLRGATVGMIAAAGLSLFIKVILAEGAASVRVMGTAFDPLALVIFFGALYLLRRKKLGTMTVMLLCGAVGVAGYFLSHLFGG